MSKSPNTHPTTSAQAILEVACGGVDERAAQRNFKDSRGEGPEPKSNVMTLV